MFITAKLVYLDARRGEMISASAGHCPLLVARGADDPPENSGLPLGIELRTIYRPAAQALPPGGAALLYTDGLSETRNAAGELLGEENLRRLLTEAAAQTGDAASAKNFLLDRLAAYRGHAPLTDDQTFILIRLQK
jgi:serine phosphatase RsbU (regulator of sigma subunit)